MGLANRIGTSVLPFTNPRVVAPPGVPGRHGRANIVVATPMRSGTHVLIDLLLNNLPDYRTRPLYVDLDQCIKKSGPGHDLVASLAVDSGHVVKTHLPFEVGAEALSAPRTLGLIDAAVVLTVRRDDEAVMRSLAKWARGPEALERHRAIMSEFWSFWGARSTVALSFDDLFRPEAVRGLLGAVADHTGCRPRNRLVMPPPQRSSRIYAAKAATRLLGRHAPRIDTTIHTLK